MGLMKSCALLEQQLKMLGDPRSSQMARDPEMYARTLIPL